MSQVVSLNEWVVIDLFLLVVYILGWRDPDLNPPTPSVGSACLVVWTRRWVHCCVRRWCASTVKCICIKTKATRANATGHEQHHHVRNPNKQAFVSKHPSAKQHMFVNQQTFVNQQSICGQATLFEQAILL